MIAITTRVVVFFIFTLFLVSCELEVEEDSTPPATTTTEPTLTPVLTVVIEDDVPDPLFVTTETTFGSCPHRETALVPLVANDLVCIQEGVTTSSLKGLAFVWVLDPQSIDDYNARVEKIGLWLRDQGLDACDKTLYQTEIKTGDLLLRKGPSGIPSKDLYLDPQTRLKPSFCQ